MHVTVTQQNYTPQKLFNPTSPEYSPTFELNKLLEFSTTTLDKPIPGFPRNPENVNKPLPNTLPQPHFKIQENFHKNTQQPLQPNSLMSDISPQEIPSPSPTKSIVSSEHSLKLTSEPNNFPQGILPSYQEEVLNQIFNPQQSDESGVTKLQTQESNLTMGDLPQFQTKQLATIENISPVMGDSKIGGFNTFVNSSPLDLEYFFFEGVNPEYVLLDMYEITTEPLLSATLLLAKLVTEMIQILPKSTTFNIMGDMQLVNYQTNEIFSKLKTESVDVLALKLNNFLCLETTEIPNWHMPIWDFGCL